MDSCEEEFGTTPNLANSLKCPCLSTLILPLNPNPPSLNPTLTLNPNPPSPLNPKP